MDIETALAEINAPFTGVLPVEAIRAIQASPAECTPRLIEIIRDATRRVQAGETLPGNGQVIAVYLLTEFQATEALPAIVEAISLPDEQPEDVFGDMITEELCRILAALDSENLEVTDRLIADPNINEFVRFAAINSYLLRARDGQLSRTEVLLKMGRHLVSALEAKDEEGIETFAAFFEDCGEVEFWDVILKAYDLGIADEAPFNETLAQATPQGRGITFNASLALWPPTGVDDTVEEMSEWACYDPDENLREDEMDDFNDDDLDEPNLDDLVDEYDLADMEASSEFKAQWEEAKRRVLGRIDPPEPPLPSPGEPIRYEGPRIGRNDPCPCGSGKKYKKCCARA